jgi:hypothetical protein
MKLRLAIVLVLIIVLFSCRKYRLSDDDLEWQPYRVGDLLIFESSKGELDTIEIKNVDAHYHPDDPLSILPSSHESLFVIDRSSGILTLKTEKSGSYVVFDLRLGNNTLKYPVVTLDLNKKEIDQLEVTQFIAKNVYKIVAKESFSNLKDRPFDLRYIYWSKEYGYLGLEFKDGYTWKLKSFARAGENLL